MKYKEIAELTSEERAAKEKEWAQALFNLRLTRAREHGRLENPMKLRQLRRDIARLRTAETAGKKNA
jgi:large subunit ribosomal protein L29